MWDVLSPLLKQNCPIDLPFPILCVLWLFSTLFSRNTNHPSLVWALMMFPPVPSRWFSPRLWVFSSHVHTHGPVLYRYLRGLPADYGDHAPCHSPLRGTLPAIPKSCSLGAPTPCPGGRLSLGSTWIPPPVAMTLNLLQAGCRDSNHMLCLSQDL